MAPPRKAVTAAAPPRKGGAVITGRILSVTFRSDHLDGNNKKLLVGRASTSVQVEGKTYTSHMDDTIQWPGFTKPEWDVVRGGSKDSHPISQTKNTEVKVDIVMEITPLKGNFAELTKLRGKSANGFLSFEKDLGERPIFGKEKVSVSGLVSKSKLPNHVALLDNLQIEWTLDALHSPGPASLGTTGPHRIYVTFDKPHGKMEYDGSTNAQYVETGNDQVVTENRLKYAVLAASGKGVSDEKECVDAIFKKMLDDGINYFLDRRWDPGTTAGSPPVNDTGCDPKPSLHHYLWLCNIGKANGECHNIAAGFVLACRMVGVNGAFEVGYMNPWPSRSETLPNFPSRGDSILGKFNNRYIRTHGSHGDEVLVFLDHNGDSNNFEGVARYRGALYAIGDARFDKFGSADENASSYFAQRDSDGNGGIKNVNLAKGAFWLQFSFLSGSSDCGAPYPNVGMRTISTDKGRKTLAVFRWEDK